jgi:hypothetical protein
MSVGRYLMRAATADVSRRIEQGLIPLLCQQPGFQSYSVLEAGGRTLVTVTVFAERAEVEAGNQLVAAWVQAHLAHLVTLQDVTIGKVATHAGTHL